MAKRSGLKEVITTSEDFAAREEEVRRRKRRKVRIFFLIVFLLLVVAVFLGFYFALRTYDNYEVKTTREIGDKSASHFVEYGEKILEYSNDGIMCVRANGQLQWNQAFEMGDPRVDTCGDFVCVFDQGGKDIYILNSYGVVKKIETSMLICEVRVASQGTVAVLMKEEGNYYIKLFDKTGEELTNGKFFSDKGAVPVDIALSADAEKLAIALLDISEGKVNSQVAFYNFGSVGQNEINNNVGTFSYEDTLIAELDYLGSNTLIAKCNDSVKIFEGSQTPTYRRQIELDSTVESVVNSDKYIAVIRSNQDEAGSHHITIYGLGASVSMENDTDISFTDIKFLANNELLVMDKLNCELFTVHSIRKFKYTFDVPLYTIFSERGVANYVIYGEGSVDEVRLK